MATFDTFDDGSEVTHLCRVRFFLEMQQSYGKPMILGENINANSTLTQASYSCHKDSGARKIIPYISRSTDRLVSLSHLFTFCLPHANLMQ